MVYWLSKEPVLGFHIGGFNILIEEHDRDNSDKIKTNVTASIDFLKAIHNISEQFTIEDGLQRFGPNLTNYTMKRTGICWFESRLGLRPMLKLALRNSGVYVSVASNTS